MGPAARTRGLALVARHRPARPPPACAGRVDVFVPPPRRLHRQRGTRPRMSTGLGREDIRALLDGLSAELAARGARAELFLVGGTALAAAYDTARATRTSTRYSSLPRWSGRRRQR